MTALLIIALSVGGCSDQLPNNVAAQSGPQAISKAEVDRWIPFYAQTPGQVPRQVPDAPNFKKCAQGLSRIKEAPKDEEARVAACRRGYLSLKRKAMTWVLNQNELIDIAEKRGFLDRLEAKTNRRVEQLSKDPRFRRYVKNSYLTQDMVRDRILVNRIAEKIKLDAVKEVAPPKRDAVIRYQKEETIPSPKSARDQLYRRLQDEAVYRQFEAISRQLKAKTICDRDYPSRFCSRLVS